MPLPKGHFKRFNIAEYMTRKRLENKAIVAKTKQARAVAVKLKRLDEKVRINCFFGLLNIYDYVSYIKFTKIIFISRYFVYKALIFKCHQAHAVGSISHNNVHIDISRYLVQAFYKTDL